MEIEIEGKYLDRAPLNDFHSKRSAASCQNVLGLFEHSGVFSDALMNRVHITVLLAQEAVEKRQKEDAMKQYDRFMKLLNTYSIFSNEFKQTASIYFQGIMSYPEGV